MDDVPIALEAFQKPHPPIWYGMHTADSAARAARRGLNAVSLDDAAETRAMTDAYRAAWADGNGGKPEPRIGIGRFIVVAETEDAAHAVARRAYPVWHDSFNYLFRQIGRAHV